MQTSHVPLVLILAGSLTGCASVDTEIEDYRMWATRVVRVTRAELAKTPPDVEWAWAQAHRLADTALDRRDGRMVDDAREACGLVAAAAAEAGRWTEAGESHLLLARMVVWQGGVGSRLEAVEQHLQAERCFLEAGDPTRAVWSAHAAARRLAVGSAAPDLRKAAEAYDRCAELCPSSERYAEKRDWFREAAERVRARIQDGPGAG